MTNGSRICLAVSLLAVLAAGCASAPVEMAVAQAVVATEDTPAPVDDVLPERQFLLLIDYHTVVPGWEVEASAARWNELVGCELLVLPEDMDSSTDYQRVEVSAVPGLTHELHGSLWGYAPGGALVELNPSHGVHPLVAMHELGHVLGLGHHDDEEGGIMRRTVPELSEDPSARELAEVREWCP